MRIPDRLARMSATLLQAVLPVRCFQCNRLYAPGPVADGAAAFEAAVAGLLCPTCRSGVQPIRSPLCVRCGIPFVGRDGPDHLCGSCEKEPPYFEKARSTGTYEGGLRCLIQWLKYRGQVQVAEALGTLLWETFRENWGPDEVDLIVPVPLHPRRQRQRGFNQAFQLVRKWPRLAAREGVPSSRARIEPQLLRRCRPTAPQTGLDRTQRKANLAKAIALAGTPAIAGLNVLVIDDVLTTGTTADHCAQVLLSAGVRQVHVLTLARTV